MFTEIVICSDSNTIIPVCVLIKSILANAKNKDIVRFNLITDSDELFNTYFHKFCMEYINYLKNIKIINPYNLGISFKEIETIKLLHRQADDRLTNFFNFVRIYFPRILPELNKIIYIDTDMLVLDDINKLYNLLPDDKAIGAVNVYDGLSQIIHPLSRWVDYKYLIMNNINPNDTVFNNGMFVTHLNWWRENNVAEKMFNLIKLNNKNFFYKGGTQAPMNIVFNNENFVIDGAWNNTGFGEHEQTEQKKKKSKIIHWTGEYKPWLQDPLKDKYHSKIWHYYKNM